MERVVGFLWERAGRRCFGEGKEEKGNGGHLIAWFNVGLNGLCLLVSHAREKGRDRPDGAGLVGNVGGVEGG